MLACTVRAGRHLVLPRAESTTHFDKEPAMNKSAISPAGATAPAFEPFLVWPAAWFSFCWALQQEWLSEMARGAAGELPAWMYWYNGAEQLG